MLKPKFKTALLAEIKRAHESGQSEAVAIADWLDGIYGEEEMSEDLILSGLEEVEGWAKAIRLHLLGKCRKCGSSLHENGRCCDITCPFNDRAQDSTYEEG